MASDNPYQSPSPVQGGKPTSTASPLIAAGLVGLALLRDAYVIGASGISLAALASEVGVLFFDSLLILGAVLVFRRHNSGRWLLIVLFGIRALFSVVLTVGILPRIWRYPSLWLEGPVLHYWLGGAGYIVGVLWLLFSPGLRRYLRTSSIEIVRNER